MKRIDISLLSIRRQIGKRLLLFFSLAFSLTAVISLLAFVNSQERSLEQQFDEYGANIVITPKRQDLSLSYGGIDVSSLVTSVEDLHPGDAEKIRNIPNDENIRAVSPKLIGAVDIEEKRVLLVGVDMEEERKIKSWWDLQGSFPTNPREVLIGWDAARTLGIRAGDFLELQGESFLVSGILLPTGSQDDGVILAALQPTQRILGQEDRISLIDVSALCSDCPIDELVSQISHSLPHADVRAIRQVMDQRMEVVERFRRFALALAGLITLLAAVLTLSVMTGSVAERHREIGIFRALGFSSGDILRIIQAETLIVSFAAGVLGSLLSYGIATTLLPVATGLARSDIVLPLWMPLAGGFVLVLLALGASLRPALLASRIDPVDSIQQL